MQPAQFPELDVNDLAFFSNLQKDVPMVTKKNLFDFLEVVKMARDTYPCIPQGCSVAYAICFRRVLSGLSFINIIHACDMGRGQPNRPLQISRINSRKCEKLTSTAFSGARTRQKKLVTWSGWRDCLLRVICFPFDRSRWQAQVRHVLLVEPAGRFVQPVSGQVSLMKLPLACTATMKRFSVRIWKQATPNLPQVPR